VESTKFKVDWIVDPFVGFDNMRLFVVKKGRTFKDWGREIEKEIVWTNGH
jgi:hypothetical protein